MKKVKKLLALVMAMTMVLGMAISVSAEEPAKVGTATVKGVTEAGAIVTAYQLVTYDEKGGYTVVDAAADKGYTLESKDADVVAELAKDTAGLDSTVLQPAGGGEYTAQLGAGTYLVLVTGAGTTIYNPMLLSLNVSYPDGVEGGIVDADKWFVEDNEVYAKSTDKVITDKVITDAEGNPIGAQDGVSDSAFVGDTVYFTISATIPSYSKQYDNNKLTFVLTDTVSEGLTLNAADVEAAIVRDLGEEAAEVVVNGQTITITFKKDYILNNGNQEVKATYPAVINENATYKDPATNELNVTYSNSPSTTANGDTDTTYHYTFEIGAGLKKVDSKDETKVLEGAVFQLTSKSDSEKKFEATTDENGNLSFTGLDAGEYWLQEIKAPTGYQLSEQRYWVTINPSYGSDGKLTQYTVRIGEEGDENGFVNVIYNPAGNIWIGSSGTIKNTTLASLPSTGGIGTTIFTIGGCAIMIAAAALYFVNRRKSEEN